jgi:hypothetical protein
MTSTHRAEEEKEARSGGQDSEVRFPLSRIHPESSRPGARGTDVQSTAF